MRPVKLASGAVSAALLFGMMTPMPIKAQSGDMRYAEYTFGKKDISTNVTSYWLQDYHGSLAYDVQGGKRGVWLGPSGNLYMLVDIDDKYWYSADETQSVAITIDYLDKGAGYITLRYETADDHWACPADLCRLTDTGEWKSYTYYVDDLYFRNGSNMCDVMLATWTSSWGFSSSNVFVNSIKIEEIFTRKPIKTSIDSGRLGNIFGAEEKTDFDILFKNLVDYDADTQVSYKITDMDGNTIKEDNLSGIKVPASGEERIHIESGAKRCALYYMDMNVSGKVVHDGTVSEFEYDIQEKFSVAQTHSRSDEKNDYYWTCAHANYYAPLNTPQKTMEMIVKAGFGGNRAEFMREWVTVDSAAGQPADGIFGFNWESELVKESGQKIMQIGCFGNPYLYGDGRDRMNMPRTDKEMDAFAKYCAATAQEYDSKGISEPMYLEIWNEPNNKPFNYDLESEDSRYYARLLKRVYPVVKAASPRTVVVGMVTLGCPLGWIGEALEEGAYDYCDAISVHPYSWGVGAAKFSSIIDQAMSVKELMKKYGDLKPVIFSETGWHDTGTLREDGGMSGATFGVTSDEQAKNAVLLPVISKAYDIADIVCWYDLQNDGEVESYSEHNFGMVESVYNTTPYAAKKSYLAACAYNKLMPNAEFVSKIEHGGLQTAAFRFRRTDGKDIALLWTYNIDDFMSINLGCTSVEMYDLYGNSLGTLCSGSGIYSFNLTEEPFYIIGDFTSFDEAEPEITISDFSESVPGDTVYVTIKDRLERNLTVEAESWDSDITIEGDTSVIGGVGTIVLKTEQDSIGQHFLTLKLRDANGNLVYSAKNSVWVRAPFTMSIKTVQQTDDNRNRWQAAVTVRNMAFSSHINGMVELVSPDTYLETANKAYFTDLRPKEQRTFYINLPEMIKKRTAMLTVRTTLDTGFSAEYTSNIDFTNASYAYTKPVIDGVIGEEEWQEEWVVSDLRENMQGDGMKNWGGPDDLSLKVKFKWDENNFYLAAVVKDNIFNQTNTDPGNSWQGDGLQFGFEDINPQGQIENHAFTEMGMALINGKPAGYRWSCLYNIPQGSFDDFEAAIIRSETETVYEISVPWSEIFETGYDITKISEIGFAMLANDNDGAGRRGWVIYNDGIGNVKDSQLFGRIKLLK